MEENMGSQGSGFGKGNMEWVMLFMFRIGTYLGSRH